MNEVVAANVRGARKARGWTQAQLADRMQEVGISWSRPITGYVEAGERPVNAEELLALSVVFETTPSYWLAPPSSAFGSGDVEVGSKGVKVSGAWLVAAAAAGDAATPESPGGPSSWTRFFEVLARITETEGLGSKGARELHRTLARLRAVAQGDD